jgi:L-ascorbate metabolism protein UlaG (beta-lactamase superfamily)
MLPAVRRPSVRRAGRTLLIGTLLLVIAACSRRLGPGVEGVVDLAPDADALVLTYLGTGGWIMESGEDMVLTAPLFSNPSFLRTGLAPIRVDTAEVERQMAQYDVRAARAILVGHAHYDHLMDVPLVATRHAPDARIVANRTTANTLGTWSGVGDRVDVVNDIVGDAEAPGSWLSYGPRVRVMALRSRHAPHFDGYTLYQGTVDRPMSTPPQNATEWLDGETVAFLIDFLDERGEIAHRVYYQDAVVAPPWGYAPDPLIAEHPVDVAIFVPATFDQVDWHPEAFVENLQPRRVLLGHWEDFFIPVDEPTRSIMLSDIGHFQSRLDRVFDGSWWRPEIGTVFRFPRLD